MNSKVNRSHERPLRLVYSDHICSFHELLKKDRSSSVHHRNIQSLAKYKLLHALSPSIVKNVFHLNTNIPYNLRSCSELYCRNPNTVKYRTETITYLTHKIWSLVPQAMKSSKSLNAFKSKIRQWKSDCPCRLCRLLATCRFHLVFHYVLFRNYYK